PLRAPDIECKVLAFDVPELLQPLLEGRRAGGAGGNCREENADPNAFPHPLRLGSERHHKDTEGEDEHAPNGATTHGGALQNTRAPSQGVSSSAHPRIDPGQVGWLAMEETADGVHQHGVGGLGVETAGLLERQDALYPPVAVATGRS